MSHNKKELLLLRTLIREIAIAGEVDKNDMYAKYRPDNPKEYLGMVPKTSQDAGPGGIEGGGEASGVDTSGGSFSNSSQNFSGNSEEQSDSASKKE